MRRRRPEPDAPPPAELAEFNPRVWYRPADDPPPRPGFPYTTAEDKWLYHFVKAIRRYQAARDEWRAT